jgi:UDP-N-acetylmuramoyl-tripeptide--D-alanyl-D-alanine ligase
MLETTLRELAHCLNLPSPGQDSPVRGLSTDSRRISPGMIYLALPGERFDGHDFILEAARQGAIAAVVSRPLDSPIPLLRVADTRLALGRLATCWRKRFDLPLVAITGSNGKTTVKEMLRGIFSRLGPVLATQGNLNNDIGVPLTLLGLDQSHRHAVIEMGANHPGEIAYLADLAQPQVAAITLCAPAHLEGFGGVEGVARAKGEIFSALPEHGTAVLNRDDPFYPFWRGLPAVRDKTIVDFGFHPQASVGARDLAGTTFRLVSPLGESLVRLPLPGRHNVLNALAATACALAAGCPLEAVTAGLESVQAAKGRLQQRAAPNGVNVLDDSYNANPSSLNAALAVLAECPAPRWLALGDMLELGADGAALHYQAGQSARAAGVERLFAVGALSREAVAGFGQGARHYPAQQALLDDLRENLPAGATLLVKGSRGARMDKVVEAVVGGEAPKH